MGTMAILTIAERGIVREGMENRFAYDLEHAGQSVVRTHKYLSLSEIKEDKEAAATRLREAGVQTILITHLISSEQQANSVRVGRERYAPVTTGYVPYGVYGWHDYYTLAFQDMGTVWSSETKQVYLESTLFDLTDGQRLWSCLTKTVMTETTDGLVEMDRLAELISSSLRKDGLVK